LAADSTISDNVATSWLRDNSLSKLTGEVNDTSKQRLRDALADAWDKGGSYNDMVKSVTDTFEDFSSVRAGMIAQTEANDAYIEGRDATARAAGLGEKRWSADGSDTCPECEEQIAAGWIDIDDDFPSGDDPPLHPNCECGTDYRRARE
jgi:SPP1 gp7 family putative phage head morphogenesis protein